jgi:GNAT superfamily N-acetyltransferase
VSDQDRWIELNLLGLDAFYRVNVDNVPRSSLVEREGLIAAVVPTVPQRSVFNAVVYSDTEALRDSLDDLALTYDEAGVAAWTVWVPEEDKAAAKLLESAGHKLDAEPRAMGMELAGFEAPDINGLDWVREPALAEAGRLNAAAYGYPEGTFDSGMGEEAPPGLHVYLANLDGEPAATVATLDRDGDCSIWCVATAEHARGRGLSTALMRQALHDAAVRGCATTTLQASKLGRPVYEKIGYGDFGSIQMWERRKQVQGPGGRPVQATGSW